MCEYAIFQIQFFPVAQQSPDKECGNLHNSDGDDSDNSSSSGSSVGEHLKNAMLSHSPNGLHHAQPVSVVKPIPLLGHRLNRDGELLALSSNPEISPKILV